MAISQDMMNNSWFGLGRSSTGNLSRAGSGLRSISGEKMFDLLHRDVSHDPFGILHHQTSGGFLEMDPFDNSCLSRNISSSPRSSGMPRSAKDLRQYELDFVKSGRLPDDLNSFSRSSDSLPPLSSISRDISMVSRDVSFGRLLSRGTSPGLIHHISGASESFPPLSPIRTPRKLYPPLPSTPRGGYYNNNNNNHNHSQHFHNNNNNNNHNNHHHNNHGSGSSNGSNGVTQNGTPIKQGKPSRAPRRLDPSMGLQPRELALDDQALQAEIDKLKAELAAVEQEAPPPPTERSPGLFPVRDLPPPRIIHQNNNNVPLRPMMLTHVNDNNNNMQNHNNQNSNQNNNQNNNNNDNDYNNNNNNLNGNNNNNRLSPELNGQSAAALLERRSESRKLLTQLKQLQEGPEVPKPPSVHPPPAPPIKEPDLSGLVELEGAVPSSSEDTRDPQDDSKVTVGIYTRAERRAKIERFKEKKNRRNFDKKILYACRKSFADSRPRIGGRFVARQDKRPSNNTYSTGPLNDTLLQNLLALLPLQGNQRGVSDSQHVEDTQALFQQLMLCLPPQEEGDSPPPASLPVPAGLSYSSPLLANYGASMPLALTSSVPSSSSSPYTSYNAQPISSSCSNVSSNVSGSSNGNGSALNDNCASNVGGVDGGGVKSESLPEGSPMMVGPAPSWPAFMETLPPLPSRSISAP